MKKNLVVGVVIVFLVLMGALAVFGDRTQTAQTGTGDTIAVIEIEGMITGSNVGSLIGTQPSTVRSISSAIRQAKTRDDVKAVVLRINSPGGTAGASQEIGIELDKLRDSGKPVITSMGDVCASGGYWLASSTDHIVANGTTITGSIGVIMEVTNMEGLFEMLGIESEVFKSGEFKDMGSPTREMTSPERELIQGMIDDTYDQFLEHVKQGREGHIEEDELLAIADGRIFTGRQAHEYGLVDSLGNYYDAIEVARELAEIEPDPMVEVLTEQDFWGRFFTMSKLLDIFDDNNFPELRI
ncbi:Signal peptide peptidase SppA (protease 4) [Candidatus Syntrophocurvum alkaliphilum]|uniref:Signal peptide peptidase SppA (Protease 4) n=1 Tax=Candidatus Syntrophocurvum alkaliphilum TaxID=2293317 RepID=A0A6I6DNM2_9FIRM|nr:signal peptide peptidase SppA [Candidatus Syntrophocurvum alkaliphilum]QGU00701.1 Signal peptide peptidase SppA (protease 4) [Candidatus Syntrophocurvum alkaliphilum]